jgi:hypothetical protein
MFEKAPFRFDGHGVNDREGQRLAKLATEPYLFDTGKPVRNPEHDQLGRLFAESPQMFAFLKDVDSVLKEMGFKDDGYLRATIQGFTRNIQGPL